VSDEQTPLWRWIVVGLLCSGAAVYFLATGEIPVDKRRTMSLTRAGDPALYWLAVLAFGALGGAALARAWKRLFRE
jgi:hypothetical protein